MKTKKFKQTETYGDTTKLDPTVILEYGGGYRKLVPRPWGFPWLGGSR